MSATEAEFGLDLRSSATGSQHVLWFMDAADRDRFMRELVGGISAERLILVDPIEQGSVQTLDRAAAKILDSAGGLVSGLILDDMGLDGHGEANRLWAIAGHLVTRSRVSCPRCERSRAACDYDPCSANPRTGHVRETATPTAMLTNDELEDLGLLPLPDGRELLVADCSCGAVYLVPAGGDEYAALEAAHKAHIAEMRTGC